MKYTSGDRFNNSKGELCQVIALAKDDRDNTTRLVYQVLSGNYELRICSVEQGQETAATNIEKTAPAAEPVTNTAATAVIDGEVKEIFEGEVNPYLLEFLEADSVDEKLEVIYNIKDTEDERLLSAIEASLDITSTGGSPEERVYFIRQTLLTRAKFEGSRLR